MAISIFVTDSDGKTLVEYPNAVSWVISGDWITIVDGKGPTLSDRLPKGAVSVRAEGTPPKKRKATTTSVARKRLNQTRG